jgi:hypothetical protein
MMMILGTTLAITGLACWGEPANSQYAQNELAV